MAVVHSKSDAFKLASDFREWALGEGYDVAHTYDTERSRWVFLNPMTADLWKAWQAARGVGARERAEPVLDALQRYQRAVEAGGKKEDLIDCYARAENVIHALDPVAPATQQRELVGWQFRYVFEDQGNRPAAWSTVLEGEPKFTSGYRSYNGWQRHYYHEVRRVYADAVDPYVEDPHHKPPTAGVTAAPAAQHHHDCPMAKPGHSERLWNCNCGDRKP